MNELHPSEMRNRITDLANAMLARPDIQIDVQIDHFFAPGIYVRQMTMPKGSTVVGMIHKTEHICILTKGSVSVANAEGTELYHAPCVIHSMPGTQRALHALEETVWINIHHNPENLTDLEKIEENYVVDTFEKFLEHEALKKIEGVI